MEDDFQFFEFPELFKRCRQAAACSTIVMDDDDDGDVLTTVLLLLLLLLPPPPPPPPPPLQLLLLPLPLPPLPLLLLLQKKNRLPFPAELDSTLSPEVSLMASLPSFHGPTPSPPVSKNRFYAVRCGKKPGMQSLTPPPPPLPLPVPRHAARRFSCIRLLHMWRRARVSHDGPTQAYTRTLQRRSLRVGQEARR